MDGSIPQPSSGLVFEGTEEAQSKLMTELALARLEFGDIEKDRTGQYGYQHFKYATLGMLTAATLPALAKHGIAVMQAIGNCPHDTHRQRITTLLCGHGAKIISSLDFDPLFVAKQQESGKGEAIKEYGKLRTYLRRYEYQTLLVLDAEPDADEAGVKPPQEPQKRREAPTPPQARQERREPAPRQESPRQPPPTNVQQPGAVQSVANNHPPQLAVVPPPTKTDPLAEKLSTPVNTDTATAVPGTAEPRVEREDDPPASQALQDEFLAEWRTSGMTKIQFGSWCLETFGVSSPELRDRTSLMVRALDALRDLKKKKSAGAA